VFQDVAAFTMKGRLTLKSRRAEHLIAGILQASKYKINGKINLHSAVIAFNFYIHVLSPFILVAAVLVFLTLIVVAPWFAIMLVPLLCILSLKKARLFVISYLTSNIALANGLFRHFFMKKKVTWKKIDEMRRK
jgi:thiosulfate reductase cytochrome b subunit